MIIRPFFISPSKPLNLPKIVLFLPSVMYINTSVSMVLVFIYTYYYTTLNRFVFECLFLFFTLYRLSFFFFQILIPLHSQNLFHLSSHVLLDFPCCSLTLVFLKCSHRMILSGLLFLLPLFRRLPKAHPSSPLIRWTLVYFCITLVSTRDFVSKFSNSVCLFQSHISQCSNMVLVLAALALLYIAWIWPALLLLFLICFSLLLFFIILDFPGLILKF